MDTPLQWAAGLAIGMVAGFVPPESLIVPVLALMLLLGGCNLLTGLFGWIMGVGMGSALAPLSEAVGYHLLTAPSLQPAWVAISEMPLGYWCRWENTLVTGSLATGIASALPVFVFALLLGKPLRRQLSAVFRGSPWTRWLAEPPRAEMDRPVTT